MTSNGRSLSDWVVSLQNKILMPDPHSETGSQDIIIIGASESLVKLGPKLSGYCNLICGNLLTCVLGKSNLCMLNIST